MNLEINLKFIDRRFDVAPQRSNPGFNKQLTGFRGPTHQEAASSIIQCVGGDN